MQVQRQRMEDQAADRAMVDLFVNSSLSPEMKLASFSLFSRPRYLGRFLGLYELFKLIVGVKGSIVDCGVYGGASIMAWAKLAQVIDPANLRRSVYGFDTFTGFPSVDARDGNAPSVTVRNFETEGGLAEVQAIVDAFETTERPDADRSIIQLVPGDAVETIPAFMEENPHVVVALLFLDFDLYEPTVAALRHLVPRMPKGAVLAFDELDDPEWPGETLAVVSELGLGNLRIERFPFDTPVGFARIE